MQRERQVLVVAVVGALLAIGIWSCLSPRSSMAPAVVGGSTTNESAVDVVTPSVASEEAQRPEVALRRHAVHEKQAMVWVERMHEALGLPFHGALPTELKASIEASLAQAAESSTATVAMERLARLAASAAPRDRKRYHLEMHGIALQFGQLQALADDAYLRYGGHDFVQFYERCMNHYPDHYFACVGSDAEGRQILLVVPAPPGSQIAVAADAALALAQQGF